MRNTIQKGSAAFITMFLLLAMITPVVPGFSSDPVKTTVTCPQPSPYVTSQTGSSVAFAWSAVSGATGYKVWYIRNGTDASGEFSTGNTYMSFSNLPGGTYSFRFVTVCDSGASQEIIIEDIMI